MESTCNKRHFFSRMPPQEAEKNGDKSKTLGSHWDGFCECDTNSPAENHWLNRWLRISWVVFLNAKSKVLRKSLDKENQHAMDFLLVTHLDLHIGPVREDEEKESKGPEPKESKGHVDSAPSGGGKTSGENPLRSANDSVVCRRSGEVKDVGTSQFWRTDIEHGAFLYRSDLLLCRHL